MPRGAGFWTSALVGVLALGLSLSGVSSARWVGSAAISGATLHAGNIETTISGFAELAHQFTGGQLTDTGWFAVTSSGTETLSWTTSVALNRDYPSALDDALTATVWQVKDSSECSPSSTPTEPWSGRWSAFPSYEGSLTPQATSTFCVRTVATDAVLTTAGTLVPTLTVTGSLPGTGWMNAATASATLSSSDAGTAHAGPPYERAVLEDFPRHYWPLDEGSGEDVRDVASGVDGTAAGGVTRGVEGALFGNRALASAFSGDEKGVVSTWRAEALRDFSVEAWFASQDSDGGEIVGWGDPADGGAYDRHIYLDESGRVNFSVFSPGAEVVTSPNSVNDGGWHHVVGELSAAGLALYLDGALVAVRTDIARAAGTAGYWRIGYDGTTGERGALRGAIDEVVVYPTALSSARILWHYALGSGSPYPSFTTALSDSSAFFDASGSTATDADTRIESYAWDFGDGTQERGVTTEHGFPREGGSFHVVLTVTDARGRSLSTEAIVQLEDPSARARPSAPTFADINATAATVTWSAPSDGTPMASYLISRDGKQIGETKEARFADADLTPGATYSYEIRGVDDRGTTTDPGPARALTTPSFDVDRSYRVQALDLEMCVHAASAETGTGLDQTACSRPEGQSIRLLPDGEGFYRILLQGTEAAVWTARVNPRGTGGLVVVDLSSSASDRLWSLEAQPDGKSLHIVNASSRLCVAVTEPRDVDGAAIIQSACSPDDRAQLFTLVDVP